MDLQSIENSQHPKSIIPDMKRYKFRVNKATIVYVDAEDVITAKQIVMDSGYRKAELVTITKVIP